MHEPHDGEVWDIDFSPQVGREQGGRRPALVLSNEPYNRAPNGLHIVVPITGTDRGLAYHVIIEPPEGGLTKTSVIMCEQVKAQSIQRFRRRRGAVARETLHQVRGTVSRFIEPG